MKYFIAIDSGGYKTESILFDQTGNVICSSTVEYPMYQPQNGYIKLSNEDEAKGLQKMLDLLDDNDDVQNVWHNWEDAE